jgi:hypothetical protein
MMRFVQSCLFDELGRVDVYPGEATACSVRAPSSAQFVLERQVRVPSSLSSPRPKLIALCHFIRKSMLDVHLLLPTTTGQVGRHNQCRY